MQCSLQQPRAPTLGEPAMLYILLVVQCDVPNNGPGYEIPVELYIHTNRRTVHEYCIASDATCQLMFLSHVQYTWRQYMCSCTYCIYCSLYIHVLYCTMKGCAFRNISNAHRRVFAHRPHPRHHKSRAMSILATFHFKDLALLRWWPKSKIVRSILLVH